MMYPLRCYSSAMCAKQTSQICESAHACSGKPANAGLIMHIPITSTSSTAAAEFCASPIGDGQSVPVNK